MSRGMGIRQREILTVLAATPAIHFRDLLPGTYTRAQYSATYRAAHRLAGAGKLDIWQYGLCRSALIVARVGLGWRTAASTAEARRKALSVVPVPEKNRFNTYRPIVIEGEIPPGDENA
jgi:hypothetical protein